MNLAELKKKIFDANILIGYEYRRKKVILLEDVEEFEAEIREELKNRPKRTDKGRKGRWGEITDSPQSVIIQHEEWFGNFKKNVLGEGKRR